MPVRLLSPDRACNQRVWDHIICDYPATQVVEVWIELGTAHGAVVIGIETCASHESTRHALLSRTPLDLCMGASQNSPNHPLETPKLSLPPCVMRVTSRRQGDGRGLA
jgi:hypothetical protein